LPLYFNSVSDVIATNGIEELLASATAGRRYVAPAPLGASQMAAWDDMLA
jgi:hypothetical protein